MELEMDKFRVVEQNPFVMYRARFTRAEGAPITNDSGWVYLYRTREGGGFWQLSKHECRFYAFARKPEDVRAAFKAAGPWWYVVDLDTIEKAEGAKQIHQTEFESHNATPTQHENATDAENSYETDS